MVVVRPIMQPGFPGRYPLLAVELGGRRPGLAAKVEALVHKGLPELVQ
jgi:hypothetical protein